MNSYELLYIISPSITDEAKEVIINKVSEIIEKNNGTDVVVEKWGNKKLAYAINDQAEGFYVLVNYKATATVPAEVERYFNITEDVMRYMCIAK